MATQNRYVFVVCGGDEHIETLNFSLPYLKKFTRNDILVVTDTSRNSIAIDHDQIIDVETPKEFTNHQASIYLKTGLHKFVDLAYSYCYLDTDVIAVREGCDQIFEQRVGPVTFAPDHCTVEKFSRYAVNIPDDMAAVEDQERFTRIAREINQDFERLRPSFIKAIKPLNHALLVAYFTLKIKAKTDYKWNSKEWVWVDNSGKPLYNNGDTYLIEQIKETFDITVANDKWQHWNGGVFLFDKDSVEFMDSWHETTLQIFKDPKWKVRDQGTLIMNCWKFGVQDQPTLSKEFNFIADYYSSEIEFKEPMQFSLDGFKTTINPYFVHVYHEFGRKDWKVWQAIEGILD